MPLVPYRINLPRAGVGAVDRLIELGALDVDLAADGEVAALLPDNVPPAAVARALERNDLSIGDAIGRDADSVWVLRPPPIQVGAHTLTLSDSAAFGTGLHATTALCLEFLVEAAPHEVLDVGTGSGILALAALTLGAARVTALDVEPAALRAAAENAQRNGLAARIDLIEGGPEAVSGQWPFVLANIVAAPLIEMAPTLVRRVGHHGRLMLSGIGASVEADVDRAYRRLGLHHLETRARDGWVALLMQASW